MNLMNQDIGSSTDRGEQSTKNFDFEKLEVFTNLPIKLWTLRKELAPCLRKNRNFEVN